MCIPAYNLREPSVFRAYLSELNITALSFGGCENVLVLMIVYNYDADLEVSDTCVRSSLLSSVELSCNVRPESQV